MIENERFPGSGGYDYVYQYKDHLGNIRLSYKNDDTVTPVDIDDDFNIGTDGWSTPGSGSINFTNQKLNIAIANKWNSTSKYLTIAPNVPLHIEFDFENGNMVLPVFYVHERINGVWEPGGNRDQIPDIQDGHHTMDLNLTGDYIWIYFEKGSSTDDGTSTTCYVDNFKLTQNGLEILEENNYYPFGLKHKGYNNNPITNYPYKYQGQELNESLGYNMYEFELRHYDAAIGRFVTKDPYEQFMSPYIAMGNNPITSFDPDGGECFDANGNKIACPDDDIYDEYRDSKTKGISIPDEPVVINSNANNSNGVEGKKISELAFECIGCVKKGDKIDLAMNERPDGFLRDIDELQLNLLGYYFRDGIHTDANGIALGSRGLIIGGSGAMGLIGGKFDPKQLLAVAKLFSKSGLTKVGSALQKHGSRTGSSFPRATGNATNINAQGEKVLNDILTNPSSTTTTRHHARFGEIMEVKSPNGQGARFTSDGKEFIGFIEN